MRANVYVDGFNLYYGAVKGTAYKWLNLQLLFDRLRSHDVVQTVYYFTAEIDGPRQTNQLTYLSALATLPRVEVILGKFKLKNVLCGVQDCTHPGRRIFRMPEEKRTDVQIALQMLQDAWSDACDRLVLVSGDSDLVPAIRAVKNVAPAKEVIVYIPARNEKRGAALELRTAADKARILPNELISKAQFPARIPDGAGGSLDKPVTW